jgi:hypothetical protein
VIAGTLTAPPASGRTGLTSDGLLRGIGVLLLLAALAGAFAWYLVLSPFSFRRWGAFDVTPEFTISEPTTLVLFEEYPGAATATVPPTVRASVLSIGGKRIEGKSLVGTEGASTQTYSSPFRDGRAIASFAIDKPGTYNVFAFSSGPSKSAGNAGTFALAPEGRPGWIGGMTGLIPLVLVPAVLAVVCFFMAHWLRVRREPDPPPPSDLP